MVVQLALGGFGPGLVGLMGVGELDLGAVLLAVGATDQQHGLVSRLVGNGGSAVLVDQEAGLEPGQ